MSVKALRNANGIPVLVKHPADPKDMETCAHCARLCFVVATVPQGDLVERLIEGGSLDGLKALSAVLDDAGAKAEALLTALCHVSRAQNLSSEGGHARPLVHDGGLDVFKQLAKQQPDVATKLALARFVANVSTSPPVLAALVADPDVPGGLLASTGRATMLASTDRVLADPTSAAKIRSSSTEL